MPHITLEYSSNIIEKNNFTQLFHSCHEILAQKLPADIETCKSRAVEQSIYYIGNGEAANAFVHLNLKCMEGRSPQVLQKVCDEILTTLQKHFAESLTKLNLQISLHLEEIIASDYFKVHNSK